jgi:hypothetical protein
MSKWAVAARHHCEAGKFLGFTTNKQQTDNEIMKYALLVHETPELNERRKDSAFEVNQQESKIHP